MIGMNYSEESHTDITKTQWKATKDDLENNGYVFLGYDVDYAGDACFVLGKPKPSLTLTWVDATLITLTPNEPDHPKFPNCPYYTHSPDGAGRNPHCSVWSCLHRLNE